MSTVTLKTGEIVPRDVYESVMDRIVLLEHNYFDAFCDLVRVSRNQMHQLMQDIDGLKRQRILIQTGFVQKMHGARAKVDPITISIVRASAIGTLYPKLVSPLAASSS